VITNVITIVSTRLVPKIRFCNSGGNSAGFKNYFDKRKHTMKNRILIGMALLLAGQAHALISDKFKCSLELKDNPSGQTLRQDQEFFVARLPLSASSSPQVRMTAGEIHSDAKLNMSDGQLSGGLGLYYKHALKLDASGNPLEARQTTCLTVSGTFCEFSGSRSSTPHSCGSMVSACLEPSDPFDPNYGWDQVALIEGFPTFHEKPMSRATVIEDENGQPRGQATLNCQFMGSFQ
jgi:hypothetical protein